jgi:hypothetical protein
MTEGRTVFAQLTGPSKEYDKHVARRHGNCRVRLILLLNCTVKLPVFTELLPGT